jgi:transposase-like protein
MSMIKKRYTKAEKLAIINESLEKVVYLSALSSLARILCLQEKGTELS